MTSVSASNIIPIPTQPVGSRAKAGIEIHNSLTSQVLYLLSDFPHPPHTNSSDRSKIINSELFIIYPPRRTKKELLFIHSSHAFLTNNCINISVDNTLDDFQAIKGIGDRKKNLHGESATCRPEKRA